MVGPFGGARAEEMEHGYAPHHCRKERPLDPSGRAGLGSRSRPRFDQDFTLALTQFDNTGSEPYSSGMEVHLSSEIQARLNELATETGRPTDDLVEDAIE